MQQVRMRHFWGAFSAKTSVCRKNCIPLTIHWLQCSWFIKIPICIIRRCRKSRESSTLARVATTPNWKAFGIQGKMRGLVGLTNLWFRNLGAKVTSQENTFPCQSLWIGGRNTKESRKESSLFAKQTIFLEENKPKFSFHFHLLSRRTKNNRVLNKHLLPTLYAPLFERLFFFSGKFKRLRYDKLTFLLTLHSIIICFQTKLPL